MNRCLYRLSTRPQPWLCLSFFILKVTNQPTDTQTRPSRDSHAGGREKYMATHAFFLLPFLLCWALALSAGVHNLLTITCFVCVCVFLSFSPRVLSCPFTQKKITQLIVRYLGSMGFLGFLLWFPHKRNMVRYKRIIPPPNGNSGGNRDRFLCISCCFSSKRR
jgi:hypothetical protein